MTHRAIAVAILMLGAAPAFAADYVESFDGPLVSVMLNGALSTGTSGAWTTRVSDGALTLTNTDTPNAVRYIAVEDVVYPGAGGPTSTHNATIEIVARAEAEEKAGVGVLAGFDPRTSSYTFFAVGRGGSYFVTRKEGGRAKIIAAGTNRAIRTGDVNRITAVARDRALVFLVNGSEVARVAEPEPPGVRDARGAPSGPRLVGIGAFGQGTFSFDEVRIAPPYASGRNPPATEASPRPTRPTVPGDTLE